MPKLSGCACLEAKSDQQAAPWYWCSRLRSRLTAGASINVLTSERLTDMGRGATFYSALVEVEPLCGPVRLADARSGQAKDERSGRAEAELQRG